MNTRPGLTIILIQFLLCLHSSLMSTHPREVVAACQIILSPTLLPLSNFSLVMHPLLSNPLNSITTTTPQPALPYVIQLSTLLHTIAITFGCLHPGRLPRFQTCVSSSPFDSLVLNSLKLLRFLIGPKTLGYSQWKLTFHQLPHPS